MKKIKLNTLLLPLFSMCLLSSCNENVDNVTQVHIDIGTLIDMSKEIKNDSHMKKVKYEEVEELISEEKNFLLLVHSTVNFCSCYHDWHDNILAPYIKKHNLQVYFLDYQDIENKEEEGKWGLKLYSNHETLAIFEKGKLKYQNDNKDQDKPWVNSYEAFSSWMDARITYPRMLEVNLNLLDKMYTSEEKSEFTIYFGRGGCSDCSYLEDTSITSYFRNNDNTSPLYYIDTNVEGIRLVKDEEGKLYGPSSEENASIYQKEAMVQYTKFKEDYGLSYSQTNPMGYGEGYFPTIYHINPDGINKNGSVIDTGGVFYNDDFDYDSQTITASYFDETKPSMEQFEYLNNVSTKVLQGKRVELEKGNLSKRDYYHQSNRPYVEPILNALLDWCIKN